MKTYNDFVEEKAKIVGKVNLQTTYFSPRKKRGYTEKPKTDTSALQKGVGKINRICADYDAYTEMSSSFHIVDRFKRDSGKGDREFGVDDIVSVFKGLEDNTSFFDDLEFRSNVKREENRKVHLVDRKRKTHIIAKVIKSKNKKFKYFIPLVSIMGNFDLKYISNRKNKVYYAY